MDKEIKNGGEAYLSSLQPEANFIKQQHNLLPKYINFNAKYCLMANWGGYYNFYIIKHY